MVYATVVVFLITALVNTVNTIIRTTFKKRGSDKRYYFVLFMVTIVFTTLGYLIEITAVNEGAALTGVKISSFGLCYMYPLFLLFVIDYCRVRVSARVFALLRWGIISAASVYCLLIWTADRHHLLFSSQYFDPQFPARGLRVFPGPLYPFTYILSLVCVFAAAVILVRRYMAHGAKTRKIYGAILLLGVTPLVTNLIYISQMFGVSQDAYTLNLTPFALPVVNLFFYLTILRHGLFDFVPIAYSSVMASLKDAFVIIDADFECLDANSVALEMFPGITECRNGVTVSSVPNWPEELTEVSLQDAVSGVKFSVGSGDNEKVVEASVDIIIERESRIGYVVIIRDITENHKLMRELERAAYTDPLTGIYNRRHFMELAGKEFERSKRTDYPCYAMIIDLDDYKRVNDTHGHFAGDVVLQEVVTRIKEVMRSYDLFARYGGDEFAVLLAAANDMSFDVAMRLANRICESVTGMPYKFGGAEFTITLSIGIASAAEASTLEELLLLADNAMYRAKREGRNRVAVSAKERTERTK